MSFRAEGINENLLDKRLEFTIGRLYYHYESNSLLQRSFGSPNDVFIQNVVVIK